MMRKSSRLAQPQTNKPENFDEKNKQNKIYGKKVKL